MVKVLIVEDEKNLLESLAYAYRRESYSVLTSMEGEDALEVARDGRPDIIVLDIMLPGMDGLEVCRRLRTSGSNVPIIMVTAKDAEIDRVVALEVGADDYVTKPFSVRELLARTKAVLRRAGMRVAEIPTPLVLRAEELVLDQGARRVRVNGQEIRLKPKEFDLLAFLMRHPGRVLSREELLRYVWGYDCAGVTRTVDAHIRALRDKLGDNADTPRWIETARGVGYRFREGV